MLPLDSFMLPVDRTIQAIRKVIRVPSETGGGLPAALDSVRHDVGLVRIRQEWRQTYQVLAATASCGRHVGRERLPTSRIVTVIKKGNPGGRGLLQLAGCSDSEKGSDERDESDVHLHGKRCTD